MIRLFDLLLVLANDVNDHMGQPSILAKAMIALSIGYPLLSTKYDASDAVTVTMVFSNDATNPFNRSVSRE